MDSERHRGVPPRESGDVTSIGSQAFRGCFRLTLLWTINHGGQSQKDHIPTVHESRGMRVAGPSHLFAFLQDPAIPAPVNQADRQSAGQPASQSVSQPGHSVTQPVTQSSLLRAQDFRPQTTIPAPRMLETRRLQSGSDPLLPEAEDGPTQSSPRSSRGAGAAFCGVEGRGCSGLGVLAQMGWVPQKVVNRFIFWGGPIGQAIRETRKRCSSKEM